MTKPVPHPTHDIICVKCKHFLQTHAKLCAVTPEGYVTRVSLLERGVNVANMHFSLMGPCTAGPGIWQLVDSEHWCGHYESRDSF